MTTAQSDQAPANLPAAPKKPRNPIEAELMARLDNLIAVAPPGYSVNRTIQVATAVCYAQPKLLECTPASIVLAVKQGVELGLDFSKASGQAYLVPFDEKYKDGNADRWRKAAQLIIGYRGWKKMILESGLVSALDVQVIYEGEKFEAVFGTELRITHIPDPRGKKPVAAYAIVTFKDGVRQPFLCREEDIKRARSMSKSLKANPPSGPWLTDEAAMVAKTCLHRGRKFLPETPLLVKAGEYDEPEYVEPSELPAALPSAGHGGLRNALTIQAKPTPEAPAPPGESIGETPPVNGDPGGAPLTKEDALFVQTVGAGMDEEAAKRSRKR